MKILFVDDDADEYYLFNEALEQSSLEADVIRAKDGQQSIDILSTQQHPDIIFMDINMPYKDGIETLTEIKADERLKQIPVIMFSTSKNLNYINNCYKKGATFYITEPESFDDMIKIVKQVFSIEWKQNFPQPLREDFIIEYWAQ